MGDEAEKAWVEYAVGRQPRPEGERLMDARSALEALTVLHRKGSYAANFGNGPDVAVCMSCRDDGWPCETRRVIDIALSGEEVTR